MGMYNHHQEEAGMERRADEIRMQPPPAGLPILIMRLTRHIDKLHSHVVHLHTSKVGRRSLFGIYGWGSMQQASRQSINAHTPVRDTTSSAE